jgi:hypothetical protein
MIGVLIREETQTKRHREECHVTMEAELGEELRN